MSDKTLQRLTAAAVALVAVIAAVVSYSHLYHLAITHGETRLDATLLPLSIDGTVVAASLLMLRAARTTLGTPWLARAMLVAAVAMTVAANVAYGWSWAVWGILMAGWPAAAFLGNAEAVIGFGRKARGGGPEASSDVPDDAPHVAKDRFSAARVALERSIAAGYARTANSLVTDFGITRSEAKDLVESVRVASNGHAHHEVPA